MNQIIMNSFVLSSLFSEYAKNIVAYIDPNTGGLLVQALATVFGLFSAFLLLFSRQIRMALARAKRFMRGLFKRGAPQVEIVPKPIPHGVD
ncbi:unnamed protein product [marine sediment metagenome]|uniref:Uncharacterized protein n=1 Tax=marine sediment metagenome TaxID=412755 RepID=X1IYU8_9ZZZZ